MLLTHKHLVQIGSETPEATHNTPRITFSTARAYKSQNTQDWSAQPTMQCQVGV
jgi:hypothetical protein